MKRCELFLSTIDSSAGRLAQKYGLGVEIADYCMASNMDALFSNTDSKLTQSIAPVKRRVFHGPFSELFPCAVDPRARGLAMERFCQASQLAEEYATEKVVFHAGFIPHVYFPCWYVEQSILFWREFLKSQPKDRLFCLENVMESDPKWIRDIVSGVADPRLGICLDVGHANVYSDISAAQWIETLSDLIRHFHIHNNDGTRDAHGPLASGSIPMAELLSLAACRCSDASYTLEVSDGEPEIQWLLEQDILED